MNEGLRVSMGSRTWARMRNSAATCEAAELLRAEGQLGTVAAGARADMVVPDGDPLEDIGLLADPAAHMALVIQACAVARAALTRGRRRSSAAAKLAASSSGGELRVWDLPSRAGLLPQLQDLLDQWIIACWPAARRSVSS